MKPVLRIEADGQDVTEVLEDRLTSLEIVDEEGMKSDRLSLALDDRDHRIVLPAHGARLAIWLGMQGGPLAYMGSYVTDQTAGSEPPYRVTIEAKAADMATPLRSPKTRPWIDMTLGEIAARIASEAGLEAIVSDSIAGVHYPMIAQTAESDLHLLTRLTRTLDATAKPADQKLLILRRGEGLTAAGQPITPSPILRANWSSIDWKIGERGKYQSVKAEWSEIDGGALRSVIAGDGAPELRLRHPFSSESEAQEAAQAALSRSLRGDLTVDVNLASFDPSIFAGGLVEFPDLRAEFAGRFHIKSVRHSLGSGLTTSFSCEKANP